MSCIICGLPMAPLTPMSGETTLFFESTSAGVVPRFCPGHNPALLGAKPCERCGLMQYQLTEDEKRWTRRPYCQCNGAPGVATVPEQPWLDQLRRKGRICYFSTDLCSQCNLPRYDLTESEKRIVNFAFCQCDDAPRNPYLGIGKQTCKGTAVPPIGESVMREVLGMPPEDIEQHLDEDERARRPTYEPAPPEYGLKAILRQPVPAAFHEAFADSKEDEV